MARKAKEMKNAIFLNIYFSKKRKSRNVLGYEQREHIYMRKMQLEFKAILFPRRLV